MQRERLKSLVLPSIASLTVGLAPFVPQPHVWEKLTWIFTGRSLAPIDIFDLFLHGSPWVWLIFTLFNLLRPPHREKATLEGEGLGS